MNRSLLQTQIKEDLTEIEATICLSILDDLLYGNWNLDYISFANLFFYAEDSKEVLKILPYFTGDRTHLLDLKMYFQDGKTRYILTEDQMKSVNNGKIKHPVTNELLNYVESLGKVFMYFAASNLIKNLKNEILDLDKAKSD